MFDKCETIGDLQRALYHLSEMDDCTVCDKIADRMGQIVNGIKSDIEDIRKDLADAGDYDGAMAVAKCAGVILEATR